MIDLFLEHAPNFIENIKVGYIENDWEKLRYNAHKFSPQLAFFGLKAIILNIDMIEDYAVKKLPIEDFEECKNFTSCVKKMLLEYRKEHVERDKFNHREAIKEQYDYVIGQLEKRISVGTISLIPKPIIKYENGIKLIINVANLIIAAKFGGISINLDYTQCKVAFGMFRGWDEQHHGKLHIMRKTPVENPM